MTQNLSKLFATLVAFVVLAGIVALQKTDPPAEPKKQAEPPIPPVAPGFVVEPYLQFPTRDTITILWETQVPGDSTVSYGPSDRELTNLTAAEKVTMHEVKLEKLRPNTKYVYKVASVDAEGKEVKSAIRQFMTAVDANSAFSFGVIGDTQKNPKITEKIAKLIFDRRPHFVMHVGDVVDNGPDQKEWENELFRPCQPLFSRVPVLPCIGNHEKNHANYYKYFSLPAPEYYYRYSYGNADFFSVDSNKPLKPGSEQYEWLDRELGKSTAKWKFAYHHHPVWSSDENDYGDSWKGPSKMGDLNARHLMELYEKHNLDVCFNGHIHLYERSWPVREGKVNREKGVIYVTSGGGGGGLENFSPLPNWFKSQCRVDFHFCLVNIQGNRFEMKVFDQNDNLFDFLDLQKP